MSDIIHRLKEQGVSIRRRRVLTEKHILFKEGDLVKIKPPFLRELEHLTGTIILIDRHSDDGVLIDWHQEYDNPLLPMGFGCSDLLRIKTQQ